jgi:hypothetical protein
MSENIETNIIDMLTVKIELMQKKIDAQDVALKELCESLFIEREACNVIYDIGQKKLQMLLKDGWKVSGYCISKSDDTNQKYGFITYGGFVGWWLPEYYQNHTCDE